MTNPVCVCNHYMSTHKTSAHRQNGRCQGNGCLCMQYNAKSPDSVPDGTMRMMTEETAQNLNARAKATLGDSVPSLLGMVSLVSDDRLGDSFETRPNPFEAEEDFDGDEETTWVLLLNRLTENMAYFQHSAHQTSMYLSHDEWEKLGRPTTLYVQPTVINPLDR